MPIVGTAGHVDHGKSSLVAALTGTHPDRFEEERLRGMTLDLGFALLAFSDGTEAGIIDVPGHERFIHNMLAGASGMDVLLLVIAANEGVRAQTREHLAILQFLQVRRVVVALSKCDLLTPEQREEAREHVAQQLVGTIAHGAPIVAVSSVTRENLDELVERLRDALTAIDGSTADAPAYLPIDRAFSLAGRGTIVTGTLVQGAIAVGDTLQLEPGAIAARVRSLHAFGRDRARAVSGTRVALNLAGVTLDDVARGKALVAAPLRAQRSFAVQFTPLLETLPLLRRRTPVRAHIGSAELMGTLVFDTVPTDTTQTSATLHLRGDVVAFPGVRFVVRRPSPKTVLGGGTIVGTEIAVHADAQPGDDAELIAVLENAGLSGLPENALALALNVREDVARERVARAIETGAVLALARPAGFVEASVARALFDRVHAYLQTLYERESWAIGATSVMLSRALNADEVSLVRVLAALADDGKLAHRHGYYALPDHEPRLSHEQRAFFEGAVQTDAAQPLRPWPYDTLVAAMRASPVTGLARAMDTLLVRGVLVRVGTDVYRGAQIEEIHRRIETFVGKSGRMTMAEFRDLLSTSRKYAVPLLEWFDGRGITVRSGDYRMLRSPHR